MKRTIVGLGLIAALAVPQAGYATTAWVGTADYTQAPGAAGDEEVVGPFDRYDFAPGVSLIQPLTQANPSGGFSVGDTFQGYYQSYVNAHQLNGVSADNNSTALDTDGAANGDKGYELTVVADFQSQVISVDTFGNAFFTVTSGSAALWFDTTPDYSFTGDSGFNGLNSPLLVGGLTSGSGSFLPGPGVGFSDINLSFFPNVATAPGVYTPNNIIGGSSIFTLNINPTGTTGPTAGVTSVQGHTVQSGDILAEADGKLSLSAIPEPLSLLLVGSAGAGLLVLRRRMRG